MKRLPLLITIAILLLATTPAAVDAAKKQSTGAIIRGPIAKTTLEDVHTVNTIDDELYVIDHVKRGTYKEKRLYRMTSQKNQTFELLYAAEGAIGTDDHVLEFDGALYFTVTGKYGKKIRIYRSQNNGASWKKVSTIGVKEDGVRNTIRDTFVSEDRLYFVLEEKKQSSISVDQQVALWNTADGETWNTQTLTKNNATYVGYSLVDNDPYIYVNMRRATEGDQMRYSARVYTPKKLTGKKFRQIGQTNFHNRLLVRELLSVVNYKDATFLRGYISGVRRDGRAINRKSNRRSLRSVNGARWKKAGGKFVQYIVHNDALFALVKTGKTKVKQVYISTDGDTMKKTTLSFQNDYNIVAGTLNMHASVDGSLLLAQFEHKPKNGSVQNRCVLSEDGVRWVEVLCGIPEKDGTQRIVQKGNSWYFVRGKKSSRFRLYRVTMN